MQMANYSPFPNLRFYNSDNQGRPFGVLLVKATYRIEADGSLSIADEQEPLALTDVYHGALNVSSLRTPSDLVARKPRADVIVNAVARTPGGHSQPSWICGVRVEGEHVLEHRLRVTGPRHWEPTWRVSERVRASMSEVERLRVFDGWRLGEAEAVNEVPIRYELAYGGLLARPQEGSDEPYLEAQEHNPIGRGWIDPALTPIDQPVPAPQIEALAQPIVDPHRRYEPAGFGAIPPAWLPRRPLGGTFDDDWRENVWPNWPADYDFAYNNSANPALIYPDLLVGDETIRLLGMDNENAERVLRLPGHAIVAEVERSGAASQIAPIALDTLLLDVADADAGRHRAFLSWRATFDQRDVKGLAFMLLNLSALAEEEAAA